MNDWSYTSTPPLQLHVHAHLNFTAFLPLLIIAISYELRPSVMHDCCGLLKLGIFWVNIIRGSTRMPPVTINVPDSYGWYIT